MALRVIANAIGDADYDRAFAAMKLSLGDSEMVNVSTVDQVKDWLKKPLEVLILSAHGRVNKEDGVNHHEVWIGGDWHRTVEFSDATRTYSPDVFIVDACDSPKGFAPGTAVGDWAHALPNLPCIFVGQGGVIPSLSINMARVAARMTDDPTFVAKRVGWPENNPRPGYWFELTPTKVDG